MKCGGPIFEPPVLVANVSSYPRLQVLATVVCLWLHGVGGEVLAGGNSGIPLAGRLSTRKTENCQGTCQVWKSQEKVGEFPAESASVREIGLFFLWMAAND